MNEKDISIPQKNDARSFKFFKEEKLLSKFPEGIKNKRIEEIKEFERELNDVQATKGVKT